MKYGAHTRGLGIEVEIEQMEVGAQNKDSKWATGGSKNVVSKYGVRNRMLKIAPQNRDSKYYMVEGGCQKFRILPTGTGTKCLYAM